MIPLPLLRPSPPPSYHELPKGNRHCRLLGLNRFETVRNQLEKFDRCMLGCMATLLIIFGFLIYIIIALSPLLIFLVLRHYSTTLTLSILPSPINSSLDLTPYSFFTGIGYLSPNETFIRANFHIPIRIQFPSPDIDQADVKMIQVYMYNVNGGLMGGGERSPSHSIEVPWIERKDDLLTAALPIEVIIRENDGVHSCLKGESLSMEGAVSVQLVAETWISTKSGTLNFNQKISLCCECIFPSREEKTTTIKPRKHSSIRPTL